MQVDFTPWGAQHFLRCDMSELVNKVVDLNEVAGAFADRLEERLAETNRWETRFEIVEDAILRRIAMATDRDAFVAESWRRIAAAQGEIRIERLARDLDCSRKHLAVSFRRAVGLSPKKMARIFRFEQAMQGLAAGRYASLAALASDCGYADQAHFNRDFLAFSGETPSDIQARILPDGTGIMAW
jgi:AraC-like DNA-binding protein